MRKINVITFHSAHNYGAMLQTYALAKKLNKLGNKVEIINYKNPNIEKHYKIIRVSKRNILKSIISNIIYYNRNKKRYDAFNKFMKENLDLTIPYYSEKELKDNPPNADIYITGSDQVWSKIITGGLCDSYTLNFGQDSVKRISYAASMGNCNIDAKDKEIFKNKLTKLDCISVREEDAKKVLFPIIDKSIEVVLDPTLLRKKEEWMQDIKHCKQEKEKYILAYVVEFDEEYYKIVNYLSEKTGLKVICFDKKTNKYKNVLRSAYTEGPFEFVNLIKNAEYVVATSFHATVFSIIFNKKFFIVPHKQTGARVTNLLDKLGIKGRNFNTYEKFKDVDYTFETDWKNVNKKLEEERQKSINWLNNAINSEKE